MLANDTSGSMAATDVKPTRLAAAEKAANRFLAGVPASVRVGLIEFNTHVGAAPVPDHRSRAGQLSARAAARDRRDGDRRRAPDRAAYARERPEGGRQASRPARSCCCRTAPRTSALTRSPPPSRRPPRTSRSTPSSSGRRAEPSPRSAATRTVTVPVPPNPAQLAEIARVSHGEAFTATDAKGLDAVYHAPRRRARAQEGQARDDRQLRRRRARAAAARRRRVARLVRTTDLDG